MKKSAVSLFFAALILTGQTCSEKQAVMYNQALAKWNKENIRSYYIRVNYRAFSPQQGLWELEVKDGRVARASFKGVWDEKYNIPAGRFMVDSIYRTAEAVKSGESDGPMVISAEFSETVPYIKSVSRTANEKFRGSPPRDTGFSIIILEFRKI